MVKTKTMVFSRVVGYITPIIQWNDSKQAEWKDRVRYNPDGSIKQTFINEQNKII